MPTFERLKELALDHLGGSPENDDVAVFNRLTGATIDVTFVSNHHHATSWAVA
jgi:hypothetical protein